MESEDAVITGATDAALRARTVRADEMRSSLTARLDVETLLAEAGAARRAAVEDADAILAEAQQMAGGLVADSRRETERHLGVAQAQARAVVARSRVDADAIRSRAEADVEDYRRRVREELTRQLAAEMAERARAARTAIREQSEAMIGDLAASVRILGVALETAQTNVGEMLAALDDLRVHAVEGLAAPTPEETYAVDLAVVPERDDSLDDAPGSWPDHQVIDLDLDLDSGADLIADMDADLDVDDTIEEDDPPRTAMDAYLRSAHLDFGDPPLPSVDDSEVVVRYARDAEQPRDPGPLLAERDRSGLAETPGDPPDDDDGLEEHVSARDKPLGWLFRSTP